MRKGLGDEWTGLPAGVFSRMVICLKYSFGGVNNFGTRFFLEKKKEAAPISGVETVQKFASHTITFTKGRQ